MQACILIYTAYETMGAMASTFKGTPKLAAFCNKVNNCFLCCHRAEVGESKHEITNQTTIHSIRV